VEEFQRLVAIKCMLPALVQDQQFTTMFVDEAKLASQLAHANVVQIYELGRINERLYIAMELINGRDLRHVIKVAKQQNKPVPLGFASYVVAKAAEGLDAAHRKAGIDGRPLNLVHRDVSPQNILVSYDGEVKVVDFGIAKAAKQVHFTVAGETKGTPAMMAPEQRVGEQVDVRADVYSVAAVGYELVTGQSVNLDLASLAHLGIENWPHLPQPSSLRAGLPVELDEILLRAMAYERERRPADCAALGALCEAVMKRHNLVASDKNLARWSTVSCASWCRRSSAPVPA
jgi:eukaryotic-like serine/threonine-protein kinase